MTFPKQQYPSSIIPMDLDAERRVCGALILEPHLLTDMMLKLTPDDFQSMSYRAIYGAICHLFINNSPVSPETIANDLKNKSTIDGDELSLVGGTNGIISTLDEVNPDEVDFWANVVTKKHEERKLLSFAQTAMEMATSNPADIKAIRSKLEEKLVGLSDKKNGGSISIENSMQEISDRIDRYISNPDDVVGFKSGFTRLDKDIDGYQPGNVSIIYAPSSRFKSLFVQNLGWRFAQRGIPGLWFTTEMPRVQVLERLLQLDTGLNFKWLRRDKRIFEHKRAIRKGMENLSKYPIFFCDTSALDVNDIRAEINRQRRWNNIQYVIIDLVDHVFSSRFRDEMVNNQRVVMATMKTIAKDMDVHIILVSHISKGNEQSRKNADLDVEEMTGSAAKYQDVDVAISIAPVSYGTGKMSAMQRDELLSRIAQDGTIDILVSITKNRHGELDRFVMTLDFNQGGQFREQAFMDMFPEQIKKELDKVIE